MLWPFRPKPQYAGTYMLAASGHDILIEHLDGVQWWEAKRPPRRHLCWAQTRIYTKTRRYYRCACGAVAYNRDGPWLNRNERRRRVRLR